MIKKFLKRLQESRYKNERIKTMSVAIAVIIYSLKENRKEGEKMREPRQVGYVELINGRQIAYTNAERIGDTVILTLPSGSTITLLDAEIGRWL